MGTAILKQALLQARFHTLMLQARWQTARLGNVGKIGIGLLVVATIFCLLAVLPQETELEELKLRAENLQTASNQVSSDEPTKKLGGDQALQIYYDFFPRVDSSPFWIRELVTIAKKQGVEINSSDYRLVHEQGARLARYEMILPIRGRYTQVRAFIAEVLTAIPVMAITGIVIKRDNVQTEQLDVRLEIDLYLDET